MALFYSLASALIQRHTETFPVTRTELFGCEAVILGAVLFYLDSAHQRRDTPGRLPVQPVHQAV